MVLILTNLCVFQITLMFTASSPPETSTSLALAPLVHNQDPPVHNNDTWDYRLNPLSIPPGKAQNLPSVRLEVDNVKRKSYGGAGDMKHLGGFTEYDNAGVSPALWTVMMQEFGVKSLIDVGCGRGTSTRWFYEHNVDVLCVEGSHDAIEKSYLPAELIVEHDFSRGPYWPEKTYDALWSVEVLEHISRQYHFNYFAAFRKAALIFVTSSNWGGWHHVEVHPQEWWVQKLESYGFRYDKELTMRSRKAASSENRNTTGPDGLPFKAEHIRTTIKVFVNPVVAALPEHAHLFPRHGCFERYADKAKGETFAKTRPCGTGRGGHKETPLPASFEPLKVTPEMQEKWSAVIQQGLKRTS
jgi:hypothetical protein